MKKIYSAPKANAISLHIENEILSTSTSGGENLSVHKKYTDAVQLSEEKAWSSESWTNMDED